MYSQIAVHDVVERVLAANTSSISPTPCRQKYPAMFTPYCIAPRSCCETGPGRLGLGEGQRLNHNHLRDLGGKRFTSLHHSTASVATQHAQNLQQLREPHISDHFLATVHVPEVMWLSKAPAALYDRQDNAHSRELILPTLATWVELPWPWNVIVLQ